MPQQVSGIAITDNLDGTCGIQIGPFGYTKNISDLFDRTHDEDHIRTNLRIAFLIGGYGVPNSNEFINQVNGPLGDGMQGKDGRVVICSIDEESEGQYRIWLGPKKSQPKFGIAVSLDFLKTDAPDDQTILDNIVAFLRVGGFNSLTPAAIAAVKAAKFRK